MVSPEIQPPFRVLCVDDEPILLEDLASELREEGCFVIETADGRDALARAMAEPFDAIVCDMNLPGLAGLDLLVGLRGREGHNRNTRFVLLTGANDPQLKAKCEQQGSAVYMVKPADYGKLIDALRPNTGSLA